MGKQQPDDINDYRLNGNSDHDAEVSGLLALCIFALIMLAAFVATRNVPLLSTELTTFFSDINRERGAAITIGDLALGETVQEHKARRPSATVSVNAQGNIFLNYLDDGNSVMAWYGGDSAQRAYRTRMDTFVSKADSAQEIEALTQKFGAPSITECGRRISDGYYACKYAWWLPSDIRLDIMTRESQGSGETFLTQMATDTRLMGQALREHAALGENTAAY